MSEPQNQDVRISAGEQLKHLREQKNFSVQDIASRLNLEARIIEAIEQNDFEKLSAATYARGYLRSYAKILGADPDTIISSYNDSAPEPPEIIPEVKHATQTNSSDKPVKAFTYLITLTLVILLVAWWQSNFIVDNMNNLLVKQDTVDEAENTYALSYPIQIVEHPTSPFYRDVEAQEVNSAETAPDLETENDLNESPTTVEDENAEEDSYPINVTSDNVGPDALVLRLSNDSWIEVFDALDNKVYVNLAREGQILSLRGSAPFDLVIGAADGVSVEFNGEKFDTAPFTDAGIARFTLDQ
ncbi:MAG: helix-turn-helix domain-containing protein [Gammaproteobacteria bacterium]|jgi:cytoskeleton protein RodZ|nr:helix-turn-helix domain-containing protein [Gammaproteobacteria bacterium]